MKAPASVFKCQHCFGSAILRPERTSGDAHLVCIICGNIIATVTELEELLKCALYDDEINPGDGA